VRIARGEDKGEAWEKVSAGLPLETGFNLVTGTGRAEIEFEDASTAYLGEDSVLAFNDLSATNGVPHTELALLSGTLTLHLQPTSLDEWYDVKTPTDNIALRYPSKNFLRINSYLDAMSVTPQDDRSPSGRHNSATYGQGADRHLRRRPPSAARHSRSPSSRRVHRVGQLGRQPSHRTNRRHVRGNEVCRSRHADSWSDSDGRSRNLFRLRTLRHLLAANQRMGTSTDHPPDRPRPIGRGTIEYPTARTATTICQAIREGHSDPARRSPFPALHRG
jgi:hypothetical protein